MSERGNVHVLEQDGTDLGEIALGEDQADIVLEQIAQRTKLGVLLGSDGDGLALLSLLNLNNTLSGRESI